MQNYDLPVIRVQCTPNEYRKLPPKKKGGVLDFALWQLSALTFVSFVLTYLRYAGLLTPLVEAIGNALN